MLCGSCGINKCKWFVYTHVWILREEGIHALVLPFHKHLVTSPGTVGYLRI